MATIKDVAQKAGVSVATVSHVINGTRSVAAATEMRVREAMVELSYEPNVVAQSLRTNTTRAIGILVSDISNPFFASIVRGAEDRAAQAGYSLIVCNSDESPEKEKQYVNFLVRRRIDGLLLSPTCQCSAETLLPLQKRNIPFVFVDRSIPGVQANSVLSDNLAGAREATQHLISAGHRRIGIILGIQGTTTSEERLAGYRLALEEAGLPWREEYIQWGGYRTEGGATATRALLALDEIPSALFSTNNTMTVGVLAEIVRSNLHIPADISLISFDDLEWSEFLSPPLTAVTQYPHELGQRGMQMLLEHLDPTVDKTKAETVRIPVDIKVRGSSGRPTK